MDSQRHLLVTDQPDRLRHHPDRRFSRRAGLVHGLFVPQGGPRRELGPTVVASRVEGPLVCVLGLECLPHAHLHLAEIHEHLGRLDVDDRQQTQHGLEVRNGLVVGPGALGLFGRETAVAHPALRTRARNGCGCGEVAGQLGVHGAQIGVVELFERLGDPQVQTGLRGRRQHFFDGVAHQCVHELVRQDVPAHADEESVVDQLVETACRPRRPACRWRATSTRDSTRSPAIAGQLQWPSGASRQAGHPAGHDLFDRIGCTDAGQVATHDPPVVVAYHHAVMDQVAPQLAQEEGISTAALGCRCGKDAEVAVELLIESPGDVLLDAGRVQTLQPHPGDRLASLQINEAIGKRIGQVGRTIAKRGDDHQPRRRTRPHEVSQQFQGLSAGPMNVVEQQQQRRTPGPQLPGCDRPRRTGSTARSRDRRMPSVTDPGSIRSSCGSSISRSPEIAIRVCADAHTPGSERRRWSRACTHGWNGSAQLLVARPEQHDRAGFVTMPGELRGQAGLAGAWPPHRSAQPRGRPIRLAPTPRTRCPIRRLGPPSAAALWSPAPRATGSAAGSTGSLPSGAGPIGCHSTAKISAGSSRVVDFEGAHRHEAGPRRQQPHDVVDQELAGSGMARTAGHSRRPRHRCRPHRPMSRRPWPARSGAGPAATTAAPNCSISTPATTPDDALSKREEDPVPVGVAHSTALGVTPDRGAGADGR